jgi:hypothetical protein
MKKQNITAAYHSLLTAVREQAAALYWRILEKEEAFKRAQTRGEKKNYGKVPENATAPILVRLGAF